MTYTVNIESRGNDIYRISVSVLNDGITVLTGQTSICIPPESLVDTTYESYATEYVETIFLPDLRRNFKEIKDLVLPIDEE